MFIEQGKESLEGITEVVINSIDGNIELLPLPEEENHLTWDAYWNSEDRGSVEVVREGKRMVIRFDSKESFVGIMVGRIRIGTSSGNLDRALIRVPKGIETVQINSISGNLRSSDYRVSRHFRLSTTSGDITVNDSQSPSLHLSTKSGDCVVEDASCTGTLEVESFSGEIRLHRVSFQDLKCTSKSGDISLDDRSENPREIRLYAVSGDISAKTRCNRGTIQSVSGDFNLKTEDLLEPSWTIKTVSGDVTIQAHMLNGTIRFTSVSGDASFKGQRPIAGGRSEYVFGTGKEGILKINTVSGDLRVHTLEEARVQEPIKTPNTDDGFFERLVEPNEEVRKIIQTYTQGIITRQEAVELLTILEYNENEINHFLKDVEGPGTEEPSSPNDRPENQKEEENGEPSA